MKKKMENFLEVLLVQNNQFLDTTVYRKKTHTDFYLNWNSFEQKIWKFGTLKTIVTRACEIFSSDKFLEEETELFGQYFMIKTIIFFGLLINLLMKSKKSPKYHCNQL